MILNLEAAQISQRYSINCRKESSARAVKQLARNGIDPWLIGRAHRSHRIIQRAEKLDAFQSRKIGIVSV